MTALLLTRTEADNKEWANILAGHGILSIQSPLLDITYSPLPPLNSHDFSGVIITSKHAVQAFTQLDPSFNALPVYMVGELATEQAKKAGVENIAVTTKDVEELITHLIHKSFAKPLLYLAGEFTQVNVVARLASHRISVEQVQAYKAHAANELSPQALHAIKNNDLQGILFFSQRTAEIFHGLTKTAQVEPLLKDFTAFCFSEKIGQICASHAIWQNILFPVDSTREEFTLLLSKHYRN